MKNYTININNNINGISNINSTNDINSTNNINSRAGKNSISSKAGTSNNYHINDIIKKIFQTPLNPVKTATVTGAVVLTAAVVAISSIPMQAMARTGGNVLAEKEIRHVHRGNSDVQGECYTTPRYHVHVGDTTAGGECYSPTYHTHSDACQPYYVYHSYKCVGSWKTGNKHVICCPGHGDTEGWEWCVAWQCDEGDFHHYYEENQWTGCAACHQGEPDREPRRSKSGPFYACGKNEGGLDGYSLTCKKTEDTIDAYDAGCGLEEGKTYGSIKIVSDADGWKNSAVNIEAIVDCPESKVADAIGGDCMIKKGDGTVISSSGRTAAISENGDYTAVLSSDQKITENSEYSLDFKVMNIDCTAPVIESASLKESGPCHTNTIEIKASDVQPDGTAGSGSTYMRYSFDNGKTYVETPSWEIKENGTYSLYVQDDCGNTSACTEVTVDNIDNDGPEFTVKRPDAWNEGSLTIKIEAVDEGAGLDKIPYSFDGGKSWTDDPEYAVENPGELHIIVRDSIGNESGKKIDLKYTPVAENGNEDGNGGNGDKEDKKDTSDGSSTDEDISNDMTDDKTADKDKKQTVPIAGEDNEGDSGNGDGAESDDGNGSKAEKKNKNDGTGIGWADMPADDAEMETEIVNVKEDPKSSMAKEQDESLKIRREPAAASVPFFLRKEIRAAAASTGIVLAAVLFIFAGWVLYRGVRIYNFDDKKYRYMGLALISSGMNGFEMTVENHIREEAYTDRYMFKPFSPFLKRHKNDNLTVKIGESKFTRILSKCINLELREY